MSPFKANYKQDPRMGFEGRKEEKYQGAEKFIKKMKEIQEEAKAVLGKAQEEMKKYAVLQTTFGHISIKSSSILTVLTATKSPWKDLSIDTSHVSMQSIMAEILGRSTDNHHGTVY